MFDPQLPPINVVVQNTPDRFAWVPQLIFLLLGSALTIAGGFGSDWIKKRQKIRRMRRELANEVKVNLDKMTAFTFAWEYAHDNSVSIRRIVGRAQAEVALLRSDLFDHYFETERPLVYEIDVNRSLMGCYDYIRQAKEYGANPVHGESMALCVNIASTRAYAYLEEVGIEYREIPGMRSEIERMYQGFAAEE